MAHSYKKVADDIISLAVFLFSEGCAIDSPHLDKRTANTTWLSKDIKIAAPAKVAEFNSNVVQKTDRFQRLIGATTDDGNEDGIIRPENIGFDENVELEQLILAEDRPLPVDGSMAPARLAIRSSILTAAGTAAKES